jgi:opacity protein-like surface antigen
VIDEEYSFWLNLKIISNNRRKKMKRLFCMFLMALLCSAAYAADWVSEDIGDDGDVGSTNESGGVWTIEAGGHDIWDSADDFRFIYQEVSGNFEISLEAVSLVQINDWSKVGPMARQSNAAGSQYLFMLARAVDGNKYFQQRAATDGAASGVFELGDTGGFPVSLMISRLGDDFTGSWSPDGNSWEALGTITLALTDPILVGIAVTSHTTGTLTTAVIDNLMATFDTTAVEPVGKLPVTWAEIKASR